MYYMSTIGALILRLGLWGISYYNHYKDPPTIVLVLSPYINYIDLAVQRCEVNGFPLGALSQESRGKPKAPTPWTLNPRL